MTTSEIDLTEPVFVEPEPYLNGDEIDDRDGRIGQAMFAAIQAAKLKGISRSIP